MSGLRRMLSRDPRVYQIVTLAGLLLYGMVYLRFDVSPFRATVLLGTALAAQLACTRIFRLPAFDPKSAAVSGLSLCLHVAPACSGSGFATGSRLGRMRPRPRA
jgi:hypothetical protein